MEDEETMKMRDWLYTLQRRAKEHGALSRPEPPYRRHRIIKPRRHWLRYYSVAMAHVLEMRYEDQPFRFEMEEYA